MSDDTSIQFPKTLYLQVPVGMNTFDVEITLSTQGAILESSILIFRLPIAAQKLTLGKKFKRVRKRLPEMLGDLKMMLPLVALLDLKEKEIFSWLRPAWTLFQNLDTTTSEPLYSNDQNWVKELKKAKDESTNTLKQLFNLFDKRETVRSKALDFFKDDTDPLIIRFLIQKHFDDSWNLREKAREITKRLIENAPATRYHDLLLEKVVDQHPNVRTIAYAFLGNMEGTQINDILLGGLEKERAIGAQFAIVRAMGTRKETIFEEPLLLLLKTKHQTLLIAVIRAVGQIRGEKGLIQLIRLLEHEDLKIKKTVAETLKNWNDPRIVTPILNQIYTKDIEFQKELVLLLRILKDRRSVPALINLLKVKAISYEVARTLGVIKDRRARGPLKVYLKETKESHKKIGIERIIASLED